MRPPRHLDKRLLRTDLLLALALLGCGSGLAGSGGADSAVAESPLELPQDRPLRAAFLIVPGVYNTELAAPYDVLHHTVDHTAPMPGIEVYTVSPDGHAVETAEGLRILPHHSFETAPPADILVVPSAEQSRDSDRQNERLIEWVRATGSRARFVVSLCWGAFILAEAGLLDGHAVTTYPGDYRRFAEAFPHLDLRVNVSFVHDGRILTSQGGVRSYDAAMYLVDLQIDRGGLKTDSDQSRPGQPNRDRSSRDRSSRGQRCGR